MPSTRRRPTPFDPLVRKVESAVFLDAPAKAVAKQVRSLLSSSSAVKEAVSGTWLGHALHPLLTDVVIGSFVSATLLDVLGGDDDGRASERLIGVGIAAYAPTALKVPAGVPIKLSPTPRGSSRRSLPLSFSRLAPG